MSSPAGLYLIPFVVDYLRWHWLLEASSFFHLTFSTIDSLSFCHLQTVFLMITFALASLVLAPMSFGLYGSGFFSYVPLALASLALASWAFLDFSVFVFIACFSWLMISNDEFLIYDWTICSCFLCNLLLSLFPLWKIFLNAIVFFDIIYCVSSVAYCLECFLLTQSCTWFFLLPLDAHYQSEVLNSNWNSLVLVRFFVTACALSFLKSCYYCCHLLAYLRQCANARA